MIVWKMVGVLCGERSVFGMFLIVWDQVVYALTLNSVSHVDDSSVATRIRFALIFLLTAGLSWAAQTPLITGQLEQWSAGYLHLVCKEGNCFGILSVYRICFATSMMHLLLSLFLYGVDSTRDPRAAFQNELWTLKLSGWSGLLVVSFFLPNGFFTFWATFVDFPGAFLFILVQILILIDFSYSVTEMLLDKWQETEDGQYFIVLALFTGGSYVVFVVGTVCMYVWFGGNACPLNQFFISFNWMLCVFVSLISISPPVQRINPKSGLGQSAIVSVYATYLVFSGILSAPETTLHCHSLNGAVQEEMSVIVGSALTFLALAYSTSRAATKSNVLLSYSDVPSEAILLGEEEDLNDEREVVKYSYSFFHVIFAIGAMYLAMMMTNWTSLSIENESASIGKSVTSMWMKVVSSWIVLFLFLWSLVAPMVLPERDFGEVY